MFHIIPISSDLTISSTPLGAKSIRYLYFENKNDGLFRFKTSPDTISISIDGKQICRDLLVLPFCTSSPHSPDRFPWQRVALEVNVNCNLSEIRILSSALGDFNVIMVCSDEGVDESLGFDFFESKRIILRKSVNIDVIRNALQSAFDSLSLIKETTSIVRVPDEEGNIKEHKVVSVSKAELTQKDILRLWNRFMADAYKVEWPASADSNGVLTARTADYTYFGVHERTPSRAVSLMSDFVALFSLSQRAVSVEDGFPVFVVEGTPKATPDNLRYAATQNSVFKFADRVAFSVRIDDNLYSTADFCADNRLSGSEVRKDDLPMMASWVQQKALYNSEFFQQENIFRFDHEPRMMFVYNLARIYSPKSSNDDLWLHCDYPLTFTLSGAGREITEPDTDLEIYTANDRIPMRDALMSFDDEDGVTRSISVNVNRRKDTNGTEIDKTRHPVLFTDWTLYFLFGYKKIV